MERTSKIVIILLMVVSSVWAQTDSLNISWDPNPEPDMKEYRLYRSMNSTSDFQMIQTIQHPNTHAVDKNSIDPGNYYRYKLIAVNTADNTSDFSETVGVALPKINWSVSQIQENENKTVAFTDIFTDLDDNLTDLQVNISNRNNMNVTISGESLVLTPPADYSGSASFTIHVSDPKGFWDEKRVEINVAAQVQTVFTLHFPTISFPADQQYVLWLDTVVTVSPFTPSQISWSFSGGENILTNYNPQNRRVTFRSDANWSGQETISVRAVLPDQAIRTLDLRVTAIPADQKPPEDTTLPAAEPELIVYPNPYRQSRGHKYVVFDNLPSATSTVLIFSPAGEPLYSHTFDPIGQKRWQWNVVNDNSQQLASGFYLFVLEDENGNRLKSGKLGVIR